MTSSVIKNGHGRKIQVVAMYELREQRAKQQMTYKDELDDDDLDEVSPRTFSVEEKLESDQYNADFVIEKTGKEITCQLFQETGFRAPMVIKDKTGLGMRVPSDNFTVSEVKKCVGSRRVIDVMDVMTQKGETMTMKDYCSYYEDKSDRDRLLNVISLEFSGTRLDNYVEQPTAVHEVDWVDTVWPTDLKEKQEETTNVLEKMFYPKVQRYVLMSVAGCYTDFHIDMAGTSVWYHLLQGSKVFWLIPPTDRNLKLYENWTLSGKQGDEFFADTVEQCQRITLKAGWTFMIPTGWIHAVYTPVDSLVFGGNFLHNFNASMQLRCWQIESKTHVPAQFRYPYFTEMHWYMLDRYVTALLGKHHREMPKKQTENDAAEDSEADELPNITRKYDPEKEKNVIGQCVKVVGNSAKPKVHLTKFELEGIRDTIVWLEGLAPTKKNVPQDIPYPHSLLADAKALLAEHSNDDPSLALNGEATLKWMKTKVKKGKGTMSLRIPSKAAKSASKGGMKSHNITGRPKCAHRRRRIPCKQCEPCTRANCRECAFCKDMTKYGGPGVMKQSCMSRKCLGPILPTTAMCFACGEREPLDVDSIPEDDVLIMECGICWEIHHPHCFKKKFPELTAEGLINEDLPNSWECPRCVDGGHQGQSLARIPKAIVEMKKQQVKQEEQEEEEDALNLSVTRGKKICVNIHKLNENDIRDAISGGDIRCNITPNSKVLPTKLATSSTASDCVKNGECSESPKSEEEVCKSSPMRKIPLFEKFSSPEAFQTTPPSTPPASKQETSPCSSPFKSREPVLETLQKCLRRSAIENSDPKVSKKSVVALSKLDMEACYKNLIEVTTVPLDDDEEESTIIVTDSSRDSSLSSRTSARARKHAEANDKDAESTTSNEENQHRPRSCTSFYGKGDQKRNSRSDVVQTRRRSSRQSQSTDSTVSGGSVVTRRQSAGRSSPATHPSAANNRSDSPLTRNKNKFDSDDLRRKTLSPLLRSNAASNNTSSPSVRSSRVSSADSCVSGSSMIISSRTRSSRTSSVDSNTSNSTVASFKKWVTNSARSTASDSDSQGSEILQSRSPRRSKRRVESPLARADRSVESEASGPSSRKRVRSSSQESCSSSPSAAVQRSRCRRRSSRADSSGGSCSNSPPPPAAKRHRGADLDASTSDCKECGGGDQNNQSGSGQSSDQGSNQGTSQSSGLTYITLTPASFGSGEGLGAGGGGGDEEPPYKQFKKETPAAATYVTITPKKETELEKPSHVVRPAPIPQPPKYVMLDNGLKHPLDRFVWQKIFSFLDHTDLTRCLCVCKTWYRWCLDASLWYRLDMSQKRPFRQHHLIGVVRRQPKNLNLSWTNISYQQMIWLIARLPHLKHLQMSGISWPAVSALCNSSCPLLFSIDLSWVSGMRDKCVRDLLAPPTDHKPGVDDTVSRLHRVVTLNLAGADITDEALQYIPMWTPRVTTLNLSYCIQITDAGIKKICALRLQTLDLTGCRLLTPAILPLFNSIPFLRTVQMEKCPRMTKPAMESFLRTCPGTWKVLPPMGLQKVVKREQASS